MVIGIVLDVVLRNLVEELLHYAAVRRRLQVTSQHSQMHSPPPPPPPPRPPPPPAAVARAELLDIIRTHGLSASQVALRRRLRLPLQVGPARCPGRCCNRRLDPLGDHLASCPVAGNLKRRAKPLEKVWMRVLREAGGRVLPQPFLRDLDIGMQAQDGRRVDLIARGLPVYGGLPSCGDASMVSALHADGAPWPRAATEDGVALQRAAETHEDTYTRSLSARTGCALWCSGVSSEDGSHERRCA